jgi:hypothetical protein
LPDLLPGQELRFVDKDAVDLPFPVFAIDPHVEVVGFAIELRVGADADARGNATCLGLGIERRGEQQRMHAAFFVVVGRLQQHGGLAGIHRGVGKIQFRHGRSPDASSLQRSGQEAKREPAQP